MLDVSIIIVSYNTVDLTLQAIKSVVNEGSDLKKELIVIDNGSSDDSVKKIKEYAEKVSKIKILIIKNVSNLGFSKANNQGIKVAKGKYLLLLNSDVVVIKNSLSNLLSYAAKLDDAAVLAPKLINPDGSVQGSVFRFPTIARTLKQYWLGEKGLLDKYTPAGKKPLEAEIVVMSAFLITPLAVNKVGLLDERYFMYFEDFDYCRRVRDKGLKVYYIPDVEVIHYHGASGKNILDEANQWRRLIPSSKIYHGIIKHYIINFIIWTKQKWESLLN